MFTNEKLNEIVNQSGFPLQLAIAQSVNQNTNKHGWTVSHTEHSWKNEQDGSSGFIDIVLENSNHASVLVLECKRVLDAPWVFLCEQENNVAKQTQAKIWMTENRSGYFGWTSVNFKLESFESKFSVVHGQDPKKPMLERIASELVSATEALAIEQQKFVRFRMYASVIVTTANLKVGHIDPKTISLNEGKLSNANFEDEPFIRFRKQLSVRAGNSFIGN